MDIIKKGSIIFCYVICLFATFFLSGTASAHGGHDYFYRHYHHHDYYRPHRYSRIYYGTPIITYSYSRSYPTTTVIREVEEPVVYIEKPAEETVSEKPVELKPDASQYWYYCKKPAGYYPKVERCPDGWMQVVPRKPNTR